MHPGNDDMAAYLSILHLAAPEPRLHLLRGGRDIPPTPQLLWQRTIADAIDKLDTCKHLCWNLLRCCTEWLSRWYE
jgi:hypothetical protein